MSLPVELWGWDPNNLRLLLLLPNIIVNRCRRATEIERRQAGGHPRPYTLARGHGQRGAVRCAANRRTRDA